MFAFCLQDAQDSLQGVTFCTIFGRDIFTVGIFEQAEQFSNTGLEGLSGFQIDANGVRGFLDPADLVEVPGADDISQYDTQPGKKLFRDVYVFLYPRQKLFFVHCGAVAAAAAVGRIIGKGFAQGLDDAHIINDEAVALALGNAVCPGDGLHQRMCLEGLVQVQARKALYVKAGEPHGADKHHPQRIGGILELFVEFAFFHFFAVGRDIQAPCPEGLDLVLFLADDHGHFGLFHPLELAGKLLRLLLAGLIDLPGKFFFFFLPEAGHKVIHAYAGHFVQADEHGLAAGPQIGIMAHKVAGDGFQARCGGQQVNLFGKFPFQFFLLIHVKIGFFDGIKDLVVNGGIGDVLQALAPVFVVQRYGGVVIDGTLEVIDGDIAAKGAFRNVVVGQQGSSGKTDA